MIHPVRMLIAGLAGGAIAVAPALAQDPPPTTQPAATTPDPALSDYGDYGQPPPGAPTTPNELVPAPAAAEGAGQEGAEEEQEAEQEATAGVTSTVTGSSAPSATTSAAQPAVTRRLAFTGGGPDPLPLIAGGVGLLACGLVILARRRRAHDIR